MSCLLELIFVFSLLYFTIFFEQAKVSHPPVLLAFNTGTSSWDFVLVTAVFTWCF